MTLKKALWLAEMSVRLECVPLTKRQNDIQGRGEAGDQIGLGRSLDVSSRGIYGDGNNGNHDGAEDADEG